MEIMTVSPTKSLMMPYIPKGYEKHYDDAKDDIAAEWQNMSPYEAAKRTLKELKEANITYLRLNF